MRITGTFIDEISHDIPHQNWGEVEWDRDFAAMSALGIDTVVLIRCGYRRWLTYPSEVLIESQGCYRPPVDLVQRFLDLSDRHGMTFYFGTYDSGRDWHGGVAGAEVDLNLRVIDEVWSRYGDHPAMKGWYLSQECSRRSRPLIDLYERLGAHCKGVSGGYPVLISPWMDGVKSIASREVAVERHGGVTLVQHEREWNEILEGISGGVDIVAFQDGHVDYYELPEFMAVNRGLADRHGLASWSNCETFDRDMPIKFLPIKFEKLLLKLEAARGIGMEKVITFEFSHFMSPNSCYLQARGLFDRYCAHFGIDTHGNAVG
jgi:hypothetical protein